MPSLLFVAFLAIASLQGAFGAPSCIGSKNMDSCVSKCKAKSGWSNHPMGTHTRGPPASYPKPSSVVPTSSSISTDPKGTPDYGKPSEPASTSAPTTQSKSSSTPAASSSKAASGASNTLVSLADQEAYLSAHNTVRNNHKAVSLIWNDTLSSVAQTWANGCKFQHSGGKFGGMCLPLEMVVVS